MKVAFNKKKRVKENISVGMACKCMCRNTYSSAPGMRIPHGR